MKIEQIGSYIKVENDNFITTISENEIKVTDRTSSLEDTFYISKNENDVMKISKKQNYTLDDLRQKLINYLMDREYYEESDVEIIKVLFDKNDEEISINELFLN